MQTVCFPAPPIRSSGAEFGLRYRKRARSYAGLSGVDLDFLPAADPACTQSLTRFPRDFKLMALAPEMAMPRRSIWDLRDIFNDWRA